VIVLLARRMRLGRYLDPLASSNGGNTASPSGSASTSVRYSRFARGRAFSNRAVPPMTQISSTPSSSAVSRAISMASSSVVQTRAPRAVKDSSRDRTMFSRPGRGLSGRLSHVLRPMMQGLPTVMALNRCRSLRSRHGRSPSRPITPLRARATTRTSWGRGKRTSQDGRRRCGRRPFLRDQTTGSSILKRNSSAPSTAPTAGATKNTQTWLSASPPCSTAGPKLRAGLTDTPVT
jgi:hypothetical protein